MKKAATKTMTMIILTLVMLIYGSVFGDPNRPPAAAVVKTVTPKTQPVISPMRLRVLPRTAGQAREFDLWKVYYGTSDLVQLYYNIAVVLSIVDSHAETINENWRLNQITLSRSDPNSLASMVVKNRNFVRAVIGQNVKLRKRVRVLENSAEVLILIEELAMRIEALEDVKIATEDNEVSETMAPSAAETENITIGEKDDDGTNGIPKAAGDSETTGAKPTAVEGSTGSGDRKHNVSAISSGVAGSSDGTAGDPGNSDD